LIRTKLTHQERNSSTGWVVGRVYSTSNLRFIAAFSEFMHVHGVGLFSAGIWTSTQLTLTATRLWHSFSPHVYPALDHNMGDQGLLTGLKLALSGLTHWACRWSCFEAFPAALDDDHTWLGALPVLCAWAVKRFRVGQFYTHQKHPKKCTTYEFV